MRTSRTFQSKRVSRTAVLGLLSTVVFLAVWLAGHSAPDDRRDLFPPDATAAPDAKRVARGGLLYDKWWKVVPEAAEPEDDHPLWSLQTSNKRTGDDTWRCKECHGWDYRGKDGAYGGGSHRTGFTGVWDAAQGKTVEQLEAILRGSADKKHDFSSVMRPEDIADLASFLKHGLVDMLQYVDYTTKRPIGGDANRGKTASAACAACHGPDGKKLNFGSEQKPEYVGTVARENPQEFLHKVWVGHPGSNPTMPSALVMGWKIGQVVDVLAYAQTWPEK